MSNLISALKRLERAGSEHSRATAKLREAADQVARKVEKLVPIGVELPRAYRVLRQRSKVGSREFLYRAVGGSDEFGYRAEEAIDGTGGYLHGDFHSECPEIPSRETLLAFAKDVATGWLEEVAEFVEQRTVANDEAASVLEASK